MANHFKLLAIFPHPDDETLGMGGTLAKYSAEGVQTFYICATRGERGWPGSAKTNPGLQGLGKIREGELRCAAQILGLSEVTHLDYIDGDVDKADPAEIIQKISAHIRRIQPQVVVTFGPDGVYGHPDHIALSQFTSAAILAAADPGYAQQTPFPPHRVSKLYYLVDSEELVELVKNVVGGITMNVDGVDRFHWAWPDWMITTRIDTTPYWQSVVQAIHCHQTQLPGLPGLVDMPDHLHRQAWGTGTFYRAFSLVNAGRVVETDLFAGLR
jgi:LmbE family N-acetylglucosaminyl deacetylase